jgi:hypothetical protein
MYAAKRGIVRHQKISVRYPGCPEFPLEIPCSSRPGDFGFRVAPGPSFAGPWIWVLARRGSSCPVPWHVQDPSGVWCHRVVPFSGERLPPPPSRVFPSGVCVHPAILLSWPGFPRITERDLQRLNEHQPFFFQEIGLPRFPSRRNADERLPSIEWIPGTGPSCPGPVTRIDPICGWRPLKGLFL